MNKIISFSLMLFLVLAIQVHATTITLNETNNGNIGDTYVRLDAINFNEGIRENLATICGSGTHAYRTFMLWNLSGIPAGSTITNANLSLYVWFLSGTRTLNAYNTTPFNTTGTTNWNEGTFSDSDCGSMCNRDQNLIWANQPPEDTLQQSASTGATTNVWVYWNVTNAAFSSFGANRNMSIMIRDNNEADSCEADFYSKECAADVSLRPQLVITYITSPSTWFVNRSSIPSNYNPNNISQFNITWNTTNSISANISKVFLYTNCSGSLVNYTMTNATYGGSIFNYSIVLPVCSNAYWYSKANTTYNVWNTSDTWYFTINKAIPTCNLTSSSGWTCDYPSSTTITCSCTGEGAAHLYQNDAQHDEWNNTARIYENGTYSWICNMTSGANYSASSENKTLVIIVTNITKGTYINNSVSTIANTTTAINATTTSNTTISLGLVTRTNVSNSSITIVEYNSAPPNTTSIGIYGLSSFFNINVSSNLDSSLSWAIINISYNESEVNDSNLDENSLRIYYYNSTLSNWIPYNPPYGGVNTVNNYVWANTTHFSYYGLGGLLSNGQSCNSSSYCSSGYCVHGVCRVSSTYCGDSYCDSGETNSNCPSDCPATTGYGGGVLATGGCTYNWSCTEWSECLAGTQTRACYNKGTCKDNKGKPVESRSCSMPSIPANITPPTNVTPPVPTPVPTPTPASTSVPAIAPTATIPLGLGAGLIAVIAISIVITAIILKKRNKRLSK